MTVSRKFFRDFRRLWYRRKAVSPVIASVLLIAIAIIGGVIVLGLLSAAFSQQEPINVQFIGATNFKSSEQPIEGFDSTVDYFEVSLQNYGQQAVYFLKSDFQVLKEASGLLGGWWIDDSRSQIILHGGEVVTLSVTTDIDSQEVEPGEDVYIDIVLIKRLDNPNSPGFTGFFAESFRIGDTYGPVDFQERVHNFNDTHWDFNFNIQNYGTKELKTGIEMSYFDSSAFRLDDVITVVDLAGYDSPNNSSNLTFSFRKTANFKSETTYIFFIKVYDSLTGHLFGSYSVSGLE